MKKFKLIFIFCLIYNSSVGQIHLNKFENANKLIGYKDNNGNIIIEAKYSSASLFYKGLALASIIGKGWTVIDETGNELTNFESIPGSIYNDFVNYELISVKKDEKWGFIDRKGNLIITYKYDEVLDFNEGLTPVKVENLWGFINDKDEMVISPQYENVTSFYDGLAGFYENGKWGFITRENVKSIKPQFTGISIFSEGLCAVNTLRYRSAGGGITNEVIDKMGKTIFKGEFWAFHPYKNGIANYWESYDFGGNNVFIDSKGKVIKKIKKN